MNADFTEEINQMNNLRMENQQLQGRVDRLRRRSHLTLFRVRRGLNLLRRCLADVRLAVNQNNVPQRVRVRYSRPYICRRGQRTFLAFQLV